MRKIRKSICLLLCIAMVTAWFPSPGHAEGLSREGLCPHHPEHIGCACSAPAAESPCTHV